jgi:FAD/FMN-containing dehydrogenase
VEDVKKTIEFAAEYNIRLVIRNTGHDYNGKSTGAGSLAIWVRELSDIELIAKYESAVYTGRAIKVGVGVLVKDVYAFADKHEGIAVGGNCPTISLAGGFM